MDQTVFLNTNIELDGSGSHDPDMNPDPDLTYLWSFTEVPDGSTATLISPEAVDPTFVTDVHGSYEVQLVVNDGADDSLPDTVTVMVENIPPVADAGRDQAVLLDTNVQLDGSGSNDPDMAPSPDLMYFWSFVSLPAGSAAVLMNPDTMDPTFLADVEGAYVIELVVNDGASDSAPETVTVTAMVTPEDFLRGDANNDGAIDIYDAGFLISVLTGQADLVCVEAGNVDDNADLDTMDIVFLLNYLFLDGPTISPPFPDCAIDQSPAFSCESYTGPCL